MTDSLPFSECSSQIPDLPHLEHLEYLNLEQDLRLQGPGGRPSSPQRLAPQPCLVQVCAQTTQTEWADTQLPNERLLNEINTLDSNGLKLIALDYLSLTKSLTRKLERIELNTEKLSRQTSAAENLIADLRSSTPVPLLESHQPFVPTEPGQNIPFIMLSNKIKGYSASEIDAATDYTHKMGSRQCSYYSDDVDYRYPGAFHPAAPFNKNTVVQAILSDFRIMYPNIKFNSAMVHKYLDGQCVMPAHVDNEAGIVPGSDIITMSFYNTGQDLRHMTIRSTRDGSYHEDIPLPHGSILLMTRAAQDHYDHAINADPTCAGMRISITLRLMRHVPSPPPVSAPKHRLSVPSAPRKKVLVLHDSRNAAFDPSTFRDSIVAHKKTLMCVADINQYSADVAAADVVIVSCGVNDLMRRDQFPEDIVRNLERFVSSHRGTMFLFEAIIPVSVRQDRVNFFNTQIDHTNRLVMDLSLSMSNLSLFDNPRTSLAHLRRDGVHLTPKGQESVTKSWLVAVLTYFGLRRGTLHLRRDFARMQHDFLIYSQRRCMPAEPWGW